MRIVVCIKQVPEVGELKFDLERKTLIREGVENVVNPFDRRAIAEAARLKALHGGEVVVLTMGPPQAESALRECLAVGGDRAIHLCDQALAGADTLATARALAQVIRQEGFDLILCGRYSIDAETGQVGPEVAELLGIPSVTGVRKIDLDGVSGRMTLERETDEGYEVLECPLPALLTAAERLVRPVKVKEADVDTARHKPIRMMSAAELGLDPSSLGLRGSPTYVTDLLFSPARQPGRMIPADDPAVAALELTACLLAEGLFGRWQGESPSYQPKVAQRGFKPDREVWVVAECIKGEPRPVTLELLGKGTELAQRLEGEVAAVVLGDGSDRLLSTLAAHGADKVYCLSHPLLAQYTAEGYAQALCEAIASLRPRVVLIPSTTNGRDFAPRVAARLQLGLTGDCVGLEINDKLELVQLKPAFGGNILAPILSRTTPQMATVRPGLMKPLPADRSRRAAITRLPLANLGEIRTRPMKAVWDIDEGALALDSSEVVVAVGAGIGGPEHLPLIQRLAGVLQAPIGASRKVVDLGWLPRQQQIGLTGKAIAPQLYLAIGIRGNANHTIGIQKARVIIAINRDPQADIFQVATYGVAADYADLVPPLIAALEAAKATAASSGC